MSSHQSTIVVPEDISHLHSHTSGPTNLQSIRLMLPKHPFDHDIAWVKQLQPRQHSSNKYLSFGSLGCRATARPMWISHSVLPAACSEPGRDAGAEQRCVKHSCPSLGTTDFLLPPLADLEHRALTCVGERGSVFCFLFLSTSQKLWLSLSYGTRPRIQQTPVMVTVLSSRQCVLSFRTFAHFSSYFASISKFYAYSRKLLCLSPSPLSQIQLR